MASIGRPWRGPWRRDGFSLIFGGQNGRKVEPQRLPKSIQNGFKIPLFFDPFLEAFWMSKWSQYQSAKRHKNIKKSIKISTPFLSRFWSDFGSILGSFVSARTSDFIGRGGELVGSPFFHKRSNIVAKKMPKSFEK